MGDKNYQMENHGCGLQRVAYNEMGLYEDAIEELRIASTDPALRYDAFFLMGSCARDLQRPEIAPECYEKVLQIFQETLEEASDYRDTEQQIQEITQGSGS